MASNFTLVIRRYAPFESFGGGFEGDNRGFSTNMHVSARTVGVVDFGVGGGASPSGSGFSSGSSYVGPWAVRKSHKLGAIGKHVGQVRVMISRVSATMGGISFTVETSGNLPMKDVMLHKRVAGAIDKANAWLRPGSPNPQGSPNIDTFLDFKAEAAHGALIVEGLMRGDSFPNAEVFLLDGKGGVAGLLDYQTSGGAAGPLRLMIPHPNTRRASFRMTIPVQKDGSFQPGRAGAPVIVREA